MGFAILDFMYGPGKLLLLDLVPLECELPSTPHSRAPHRSIDWETHPVYQD
jgi:hypothetical protein